MFQYNENNVIAGHGFSDRDLDMLEEDGVLRNTLDLDATIRAASDLETAANRQDPDELHRDDVWGMYLYDIEQLAAAVRAMAYILQENQAIIEERENR